MSQKSLLGYHKTVGMSQDSLLGQQASMVYHVSTHMDVVTNQYAKVIQPPFQISAPKQRYGPRCRNIRRYCFKSYTADGAGKYTEPASCYVQSEAEASRRLHAGPSNVQPGRKFPITSSALARERGHRGPDIHAMRDGHERNETKCRRKG